MPDQVLYEGEMHGVMFEIYSKLTPNPLMIGVPKVKPTVSFEGSCV